MCVALKYHLWTILSQVFSYSTIQLQGLLTLYSQKLVNAGIYAIPFGLR